MCRRRGERISVAAPLDHTPVTEGREDYAKRCSESEMQSVVAHHVVYTITTAMIRWRARCCRRMNSFARRSEGTLGGTGRRRFLGTSERLWILVATTTTRRRGIGRLFIRKMCRVTSDATQVRLLKLLLFRGLIRDLLGILDIGD